MLCYAEISRDNEVKFLVLQDDTGIYSYLPKIGEKKIVQAYPLTEMSIKLPEWDKPRKVKTNTREFLDFVRRFERNSYMETTPTEIREYEGTKEEVIQAAMKDFGQDGLKQ